MSVRFAIPATPGKNVTNIDYFKGVDLYNASANVELYRSPDAPNMIRDEVGKVRKRMGYKTIQTMKGRINGVFYLGNKQLVHVGTTLVQRKEDGTYITMYTEANDTRSRALQFGEKLYLVEGKTFLVFDGTAVCPVSEVATVPTLFISKSPQGAGTVYQPINLLSKKWSEHFLGTAGETMYQLSEKELDSEPVTAQVQQSDGTWKDMTEGAGITVDRKAGRVTFSVAPGAPAVPGMDNVKITAAKTREGNADRINKCDIAIAYGVEGAQDRLFLGGNPAFPNLDYYSAYNDPTYFGDTWFSQLGQGDTRIMGYTIVGNYLAAHKENGRDGRNIILRNGTLDSDGKAVFRVINTLQGEGVISKLSFATLGSEPLVLTQLGVYAVTTEELTGEKYSQQRSLYLSGALLKEPGLSESVAMVWRDFYLLAVGGKVYVLDSLQKQYAKDTPYSTYQYEGYVLHGIDARVMWQEDESLWFGTEDGRLCRFYSNVDDPDSYNDDGRPIEAHWDTPDLSGQYFWRNKTFRLVSCRLAAAVVTGVKIFVQQKGLWRLVYDAGERARYFDWNYLNFAKFVFSADRTPRTLAGKIKVKKVDKARFRFQNGELNEPFGLYAVGLEYTEPGARYKC